MNGIYFGTKRAFHGFLRRTRRKLVELGLTAARFDLLHAVDDYRRRCSGLPFLQSDLWRELGVTAGVVSRMARALEKLGLLTRERAQEDRRQIWIEITPYGAHLMRRARREVMRSVRRMVFKVVCLGTDKTDLDLFENMDTLEAYLSNLRERCGDTATLAYPWGHPDD